MARTKSAVAKNIRTSITGKDNSFSNDALATSTKLNVSVGESVNKISAHIEKLSENEQKFFKDLIDEIKKVPQTAGEFEKQQQQLYQNLIKTSAKLRDLIEAETDDAKKTDLKQSLDLMEKRGKDIEKELPRGPRTFKERFAADQFQGDPREVEQKGFFGTLFAQSKREIFGSKQTKPTFDDLVKAEQDVSKVKDIPEKSLKEKTRDNVEGLAALSRNIKGLLSEVTVIRKVVEGRIKFDPNSKGNKYYELGAEGKKKSVTSESIRSAGTGLFTKEELGEKLGLTPAQIKKKKLAELEQMAMQENLIDLYKEEIENKEEQQQLDEKLIEAKEEAVKQAEVEQKESSQADDLQKLHDKEILAVEDKYLEKLKDKTKSEEEKEKDLEEYVKEREELEAKHLKEKQKLQQKEKDTANKLLKQQEQQQKSVVGKMKAKAGLFAKKVSEKITGLTAPQKSEESSFEEKNENVERSTALEKASEEKFTGSGSDIVSEGEIEKDKDAQAKAQPQGNNSGGMLGNVLGSLGGRLFKKGAGKIFGRAGARAGAKAGAAGVAKKVGAKGLTRILAKGAGKSLLKKIPLVGLAAGIGFGVSRLMKGDIAGAVGEVASGAASTIPGLGTAASVAIDAGLAARDVKKEGAEGDTATASLGVDPQQMPESSDVTQMAMQTQRAGTTAATKVQASRNQAGAVIENQQSAMNQQMQQQQAPVTNVTNNTYNTQNGGGGKDSSTYNMPPVRSPETSFIRYQDKRMTRVL